MKVNITGTRRIRLLFMPVVVADVHFRPEPSKPHPASIEPALFSKRLLKCVPAG